MASGRDLLTELSKKLGASGRVALVTGANRGIGLAVARSLATEGVGVLLGARKLEQGNDVAHRLLDEGLDVAPILLDIANAESVATAAVVVGEVFGRLDILVNNAAVKHEIHPSPPSEVDLALVRDTYETNVFGTMHVMQQFLPLLKDAPAARVVNVSSGLGSLTMATTEGSIYMQRPLLGYNTAKAALNSMSIQFANELRDTQIKINVADPGFTRTGMTENGGDRLPETAAKVIVRLALLDDDGPTAGYFDENGTLPW